MAVDDPDQMGRVRVWIPALDGDSFNIETLPWAEYASPLMGFTVEYPGGTAQKQNDSSTAYGFWAIPKIGATVLVVCINGEPDRRAFFANTVRLHRNRSLPAGRNQDFNSQRGPVGDTGDGSGNLLPIQPAYDNIREQFQFRIEESEAQTRGAVERQVAQHSNNRDGTEGYAKSPLAGQSYLDPQTYCWVTPGRHAIIMQDDPVSGARMRLKTGEGHQVIFDDTNERIYVSTAKGKTWIELDQDGHVHVYGQESVSVRAGTDINLYADRDINMEAGNGINIKTLKSDIRISTAKSMHTTAIKDIISTACGIIDIGASKSIKISSQQDVDIRADQSLTESAGVNVDIRAGRNVKASGTRIDLNGPQAREATAASCAELPIAPPIVPGFEPWKRPASKTARGKNWKA